MNVRCKICLAEAAPFGEALVLGRHQVRYFRCEVCGFVQCEEPYWLADAYQEALSGLDVGAVSRNLRLAKAAGAVLRRFFDVSGRFVDYGGGTGLFVRLLRDAGFDFYWADKFATNVFAKGFEAAPGRHELLTAFEVFEHLVQPSAELEQMRGISNNILFTTVLLPEESPRPGQWWYYGLEHGQHVSIYTPRSLQVLAERFGLRLCSAGELHLFTDKPITVRQFRLATRTRTIRWRNWWSPRPSLTDRDYRLLASRTASPVRSARPD